MVPLVTVGVKEVKVVKLGRHEENKNLEHDTVAYQCDRHDGLAIIQ